MYIKPRAKTDYKGDDEQQPKWLMIILHYIIVMNTEVCWVLSVEHIIIWQHCSREKDFFTIVIYSYG